MLRLKFWRNYFLVAVIFSTVTRLTAQTNNSGTEFFLGFMQNYSTPNLVLYITGVTATTGTVAVPGLSFSTTFSVTPGAITPVAIPAAAAAAGSNAADNKGIYVTAANPVSVYGLNQVPQTTDAYLGLPATLLGTEHIVLGYTGGVSPSEFQVVSTADGNQVTITPAQAAAGRPAGVPFTITLNRLQTFQLQGATTAADLSGSLVSSTSPVALFAGAQCTDIPSLSYPYCDHVAEQIPTTSTWGKDFLTVPLATRTKSDTFRIIAGEDATDVTVNGSLVTTLNKGKIYELQIPSTSFDVISTSKPSLVAQYSNGTTFDGITSDPFEMLIQPTEQFLSSYTVTTPAASPVAFTNFINVVAKTSETPVCTIDGKAFSAAFTAIGSSGYSGAKQPVAIGTHNLSCPSGMGVYVYGFASFDSYGYPGGLGLKFINTPRCDVNNDGIIDANDVNTIFAARNTTVSDPKDQRDADGDLRITVADARACQQKCTYAACASR